LETERAELSLIQSAQEAVEIILKATEKKEILMIIALWFTCLKGMQLGRREGGEALSYLPEVWSCMPRRMRRPSQLCYL
jgi:hypothetical protein